MACLGVQNWTASGFRLENVEGNNVYPGVNVNECQKLCEITQNCLYFVYGITSKLCYLKYGLSDEGGQFRPSTTAWTGHKFGPSKFSK